MSLFGAMNTAISGLNAQSAAFTNIGDNIANSQTIGFKEVDTSFIDYLTSSTAKQNESGSVATLPEYENNVQGTIQQSTDPLALAITGTGFFQVSEEDGTDASGNTLFSPQPYYTRAGDFSLNSAGFLVNSEGEYLNGWAVTAGTTTLDTSQLVPIQVTQSQFQPVATSVMSLVANVPTTPSVSSVLSSDVQVYDTTGTAHELEMSWSQLGNDNWQLTLASPDEVGGPTIGTVDVTFNSNGTLASLTGATGSVAVGGTATNATLDLTPDFGNGAQAIALSLGTYNTSGGVTQYAGTDYSVGGVSQNGSPPGSFTGITTSALGDVSANYNNGQSVLIAKVPLITFQDANQLARQNGQSFTATSGSGAAIAQSAGSNGSGSLITGSVESSNVDIATQLSALIVAQQAYSANAKMITTAQQMLETTINLKQ